jgi:hypothetical protein
MRRAALLMLACGLMASGPGAADTPRLKAEQLAFGERAMRDIALCMAKHHREAAIKLLDTDPASETAVRSMLTMASQDCGNTMPVAFKVDGDVLRGAVAEQLYLRSFPTPPADLHAAPVGPVTAPGDPRRARYDVGACVAARAPLAVDAMLRAGRRTPEERAAGTALAPALNACARTHVDFTGGQLHGALAEALFKLRSGGGRGTS